MIIFYLIYKITCLINNKIYIGQHKTKDKNDGYFGSGVSLKRAIEKYGKENFTKEIIFECSNSDELNEMEASIVDEEFITRLDTYNIILGGIGGFSYINDDWNKYHPKGFNAEYYDKLKNDPEYAAEINEKVSNGLKLYWSENGHNWINRNHTDETKRKIGKANSIKQKGDKNSQYGTIWIYNLELKKCIKIKKELLSEYISEGWIKGRKLKF